VSLLLLSSQRQREMKCCELMRRPDTPLTQAQLDFITAADSADSSSRQPTNRLTRLIVMGKSRVIIISVLHLTLSKSWNTRRSGHLFGNLKSIYLQFLSLFNSIQRSSFFCNRVIISVWNYLLPAAVKSRVSSVISNLLILLSSWNRFSTMFILLSVCICALVYRSF